VPYRIDPNIYSHIKEYLNKLIYKPPIKDKIAPAFEIEPLRWKYNGLEILLTLMKGMTSPIGEYFSSSVHISILNVKRDKKINPWLYK